MFRHTTLNYDWQQINNAIARMKNSQACDLQGWILGFVGVAIFSLTLPATKVAVMDFDPVFVGLGRAVIAGILSLIVLILTRQKLSAQDSLYKLFIVILGVVIGFPVLSALAMQQASASYGAVITGLLPLSTAIFGVLRGKERTTFAFWVFAITGSFLVLIFSLSSGFGKLSFADIYLIGAVVAAGLGYAEGAILSRTMGSWQVICWSLVLSLPILLPIVWRHSPTNWALISPKAWIGFLYVSIFSMFLGFFAWYRGLSLGGIARVGQIQLLQPFLTIFASTLLIGEVLTAKALTFAIAVIIGVALGRKTATTT